MTILKSKPTCPSCKEILDGCTAMGEGTTPRPNDISICCYCNEVLVFTEDMQLELASAEEIGAVGLLELSQAQIAARAFKKRNILK